MLVRYTTKHTAPPNTPSVQHKLERFAHEPEQSCPAAA